MLGDPVTPKTTLAIILGASEFPRADLDPLIAAANSARDFNLYLRSDKGLNIPPENLLFLFDTEYPPNEIDNHISQFLQNRQETIKAEGSAARDLIFYYVGHGGFTGGDQEYFLALRTTTATREGPSSLRMVDLAGTLSNDARNLRKYLILDCCFSASAYKFFQQSDPVEAVRRKTLESFPKKGTALLCSSSSSKVSLTPKAADYTMFSGMLLNILRRGDPKKDSAFSLQEIGAEILDGLKIEFESVAVRPKVISPDEREGDIADIPLFPNASRSENPLEVRLIEVERTMQSAVQGLSALRSQSERIDELSRRIDELTRSGHLPPSDESPLERRRRLRKSIPASVRDGLRDATDARLTGFTWLFIAAILSAVDWYLMLTGSRIGLSRILFFTTSVTAAFGIALWLLSRRSGIERFTYGSIYEDDDWTSLPEVQSLAGTRYRVVFGLPLAIPWFELGSLLIAISALAQGLSLSLFLRLL
jgi:hypothetical protein